MASLPPSVPAPRPVRGVVAAAGGGLVYPTISNHGGISRALSEHCKKHRDEPVAGVIRFLNDTVVKKKSSALFDSKGRPKGAIIREFSHQSRYNLLHTARNCGVNFRSMPTITYPKEFPANGRLVKHHLKRINNWFRHNFIECQGIWFLEFQKRGAPHFHYLMDIDLENYGSCVERRRRRFDTRYRTCVEMERDLASAWYKIVGSGDEKHLRAGVSWEVLEQNDAAIRYAAKHAAKPRQKDVPEAYFNVGRFWGVIGGIKAICIGDDEDPLEPMTTDEVFEEFGYEAMSAKGKVKKYLWSLAK